MTLLIALFTTLQVFASDLSLQVETGAVWQHQNDVKITPQNGTLVEFDHFNQGPFFHYRLDFIYKFNDKHALRGVYAPFNIRVSDKITAPVSFNNQTFAAGQDLTINYKFNSYRLGYLYKLYDSSSLVFNIGATLKVRDAKIEFVQNSTKTKYDNVGLVPLLFVSLDYEMSNSWNLHSDMDFAAAPQGRAIDLTVKARKELSKNSQLGFGVRSLEGGADNDKVYTFSWFNYLVVDYIISF